MMGVRQAPLRTDGEVAEDEDDGGQEDGEDLEVGVVSDGIARAFGVEAGVEDGYGDDEEEDDDGYYAVGLDKCVVLCEGRETIAHACVGGNEGDVSDCVEIRACSCSRSFGDRMPDTHHCIAWSRS